MDPIDIDWTRLSDVTMLVRLLGLLIPLATAVVTKQLASSRFKTVVTAGLSVLTGASVYLVGVDGGYNWQGFVNSFLNAFVPAIAAYYGLWKPTGVAALVAEKTARFGLGKPAVAYRT